MYKRLLQGILIGVAAAAVALACWPSRWVERLEARMWDLRVANLCRREKPSPRITLVFLDQNSLDWGSRKNHLSWPWPREVYAPIVNFAKANGAKAVAFDVLFTEPSTYGVEDDDALGTAIRDSSNFVAACFLGRESGSYTQWPGTVSAPDIKINDLDGLLRNPRIVCPRAVFPIPSVSTNAACVANVACNPDSDGVYRRVRLFEVFDGKVVPSLGLAAYLLTVEDKTLTIRNGWLHVGQARVPLDAQGRAVLRFRGRSQSHTTVNAAAVIQAVLKPDGSATGLADLFRGRYVLFGFTAPGLYDLRPAPVGGLYTGVEIHATVLDDLFASEFMRDAPVGATLGLVLLLAVAAAIATRMCRNAAQTILAFLLILPLPFAFGWLAYARGVWLPIVVQVIAVAPALTGGLVLNYATEGRQKRFIKGAFRQYLSPAVIDQLLQNPGRLKLGGELRELSISFSNIQGFTSVSEKMDPETLTTFLNEYLDGDDRHYHGRGWNRGQVRGRRDHRLLERAAAAAGPRASRRAGFARLPEEAGGDASRVPRARGFRNLRPDRHPYGARGRGQHGVESAIRLHVPGRRRQPGIPARGAEQTVRHLPPDFGRHLSADRRGVSGTRARPRGRRGPKGARDRLRADVAGGLCPTRGHIEVVCRVARSVLRGAVRGSRGWIRRHRAGGRCGEALCGPLPPFRPESAGRLERRARDDGEVTTGKGNLGPIAP